MVHVECPDLYELDGYTVLSISPQGLEADGWKYRNQYQTVAGIIHGDFRTDGVPGAFREIDGGFVFMLRRPLWIPQEEEF